MKTVHMEGARADVWGVRFVLLIAAVSSVYGCGRGAITIKDNGYRGILVAIDENVAEETRLIDRIKDVFTSTSAFLYQATRRRAFFKEITILVPKTWTKDPAYGVAGQEAVDKSDILIGLRTEDHSELGDINRPFVPRANPCGKVGHYMSLTPMYLMNASVAETYGPYDKVLVHEWGHLRYGVFDEYPDVAGPHFYATANGRERAVQCSRALPGTNYDKDTGYDWCRYDGNLPDENCRFQPDESASRRAGYGSIMYAPFLEHVTEFCDNDPSNELTLHDSESDNEQNLRCQRKSVWEVLREHDDFRQVNVARDVDSTVPEFTVVRTAVRRTVLVLDVSGSMDQHLQMLRKGCRYFIANVHDNEKLGIVSFNGTGQTLHGLVVVSAGTRSQLARGLPTVTKGATSIGAGIRKALSVLEAEGTVRGGTFVIISDGEENQDPRIADVLDELRSAKVTVHSVAFTDNADSQVDRIAQETGGRSFLYSRSDRSNALTVAFQAIIDFSVETRDRKYPLSSSAFLLESGAKYRREVDIDSTLGKNTEFLIDYNGTDITFTVESPVGTIYNKFSREVVADREYGTYQLKFDDAKVGTWICTIENKHLVQKVALTVSSQPVVQGDYPIIAQAFWGKGNLSIDPTTGLPSRQTIYASISKGYNAVLGASVVADVEYSDGSTIEKTLLDNGAGADQRKNDGIYSSYFTEFRGGGRYNLMVRVNSSDVTVVRPMVIIGRGAPSSPALPTVDPRADVPVRHLQRVATGGSFIFTAPEASGDQTSAPTLGAKLYPPGQVTDLTVTAVDIPARTVHLEWTAVGAELDHGQVSEYVLRMATNFTAISENFDEQSVVSEEMIIRGNLTRPALPAQREFFDVLVPHQGEVTYFFAVVAVDKEGRDVSGDISNIVAAGMTAIMSPTLAPTTEEETTVDNSPALAPTPRAWVTALLVTLGTVIALLQ